MDFAAAVEGDIGVVSVVGDNGLGYAAGDAAFFFYSRLHCRTSCPRDIFALGDGQKPLQDMLCHVNTLSQLNHIYPWLVGYAPLCPTALFYCSFIASQL